MICGRNDWDDLLEEAHQRAIARGDLPPDPPPVQYKTLAEYGRVVTFSLEELEIHP